MIKYPKLASIIWSVATAYIQTAQLEKIRIPEIERINNFFLSLIKLKKICHFEKNIVVTNNVIVVQILRWITTSICPTNDIYLKYITPKKPHQNDPSVVKNIPLLKLLLFI